MYAQVNNETDELEAQIGTLAPGNVGPYAPPPENQEGVTYYPLTEPIDWSGRPSSTSLMLWNGGAYAWRETASLEELKSQKNEEINAHRERLNLTTFEYAGKAIRCRPLDRGDIDGTNGYIALFGTFPDGWQNGWKAADNTVVSISTITDWKAFYKAMVDTGNRNFKRAQILKAQLAAANSPEAVQAITWEE